jgi:hypothetical protein
MYRVKREYRQILRFVFLLVGVYKSRNLRFIEARGRKDIFAQSQSSKKRSISKYRKLKSTTAPTMVMPPGAHLIFSHKCCYKACF